MSEHTIVANCLPATGFTAGGPPACAPEAARVDSVWAVFSRVAANRDECVALRCAEVVVSYRRLQEMADAIATQLTLAGLQSGDVVALLAGRSIETIAALLGILKIGAAYLSLDIDAPAEMLTEICDDCAAAALVVQAGITSPTSPVMGNGVMFRLDAEGALTRMNNSHASVKPQLGLPGVTPPPHDADPAETVVYILYTSGSTGRPKGVIVPQRAVMRLVVPCDFAELGPQTVVLHLASLSFDAATFEIWGALLNGGELAIIPQPRAALGEIAAAIVAHGVTTAWFTAGLFNLLVDHEPGALAPLRQVLVGGDVLSPPHIRAAMAAAPDCHFINGYGPTENTTFTCCYPIPRDHPADQPVPIGRPIRGTTIHVLDDALQPVAVGQAGELCTGGLGVALGYVKRPELTEARFISDPFAGRRGALLYRTGDHVRMRMDGVVEFLGRVDRQVKINGKRVELDAIEIALRALDPVADAAVVCRDLAGGARRIDGYVTLATGGAVSGLVLRSALRAQLPDYMIPATLTVVGVLPLSRSGKVDRAALSPPAVPQSATDAFGTANPTQRDICAITGRVLGLMDVDLDANFFDLGASSLQMIELHAQLVRELGLSLGITDLFRHATVRQLAASLDRSAVAQQPGTAARMRADLRGNALARAQAARSVRR